MQDASQGESYPLATTTPRAGAPRPLGDRYRAQAKTLFRHRQDLVVVTLDDRLENALPHERGVIDEGPSAWAVGVGLGVDPEGAPVVKHSGGPLLATCRQRRGEPMAMAC